MRTWLLVVSLTLAAATAAAQTPMTLLERGTLAENRDFQRRLTVGMLTVAVEVLKEDAGVTLHAQRAKLSLVTLKEPTMVMQRLAPVIVIAPTMATDISDANLLTLIRGNWTVFAAAFAQ